MIAPVPYSASTKFATQIGTVLAGERVDRRPAGVEAFLLDRAGQPRLAVQRAELRHPLAERRRVGALRGEALDQRMLGREQHEGRAVDGVDARGEDLDSRRRRPDRSGNLTRAPSERPIQFRCITTTFSGQSVSVSSPLSSSSAYCGDAEEPLLEVARDDGRAAAPAGAVDHLLVGQHGVVSSGHQLTVERLR